MTKIKFGETGDKMNPAPNKRLKNKWAESENMKRITNKKHQCRFIVVSFEMPTSF